MCMYPLSPKQHHPAMFWLEKDSSGLPTGPQYLVQVLREYYEKYVS